MAMWLMLFRLPLSLDDLVKFNLVLTKAYSYTMKRVLLLFVGEFTLCADVYMQMDARTFGGKFTISGRW